MLERGLVLSDGVDPLIRIVGSLVTQGGIAKHFQCLVQLGETIVSTGDMADRDSRPLQCVHRLDSNTVAGQRVKVSHVQVEASIGIQFLVVLSLLLEEQREPLSIDSKVGPPVLRTETFPHIRV